MEFGTGCLKITPAHDINDYEIGIKYNLPSIDIFNPDGTLSEKALLFVGTDRFKARDIIVDRLHEEGLLVKEEDYMKMKLGIVGFGFMGHCDADMLKTILRNLVSNAVKFTNRGGFINITVIKETENVKISVSDNGVGIPATRITQLFDISQILTTTGTASEKGSGLGLILCKELVEKHGGKIWVESEFGAGSTFYFSIPQSKINLNKSMNEKNKPILPEPIP
jgi:signal transduction histidine kinase